MNVITRGPRWQAGLTAASHRAARRRLAWAVVFAGLTSGAVWGCTPALADPDFAWPLELRPKAITGTFMEARAAHYHSGLDVKTAGRSGLRLLAPADGSVVRVRVGPRGYGKAIYLRVAGGSTLVFAHLSFLADPIRAPITRAQARDGRYEQDIRLAPGEIPVLRGELLGLTGATGTGAPHLHLEVRSPEGLPQNPLLHGFNVPDHEAPRLRRLKLVPLDASARVGGRAVERIVGPGESIGAVGRLGVQVDVVDKTGVYDHSLMPLGLQVDLDSETMYTAVQRSFDFGQGGEMRLEVTADGSDPRLRWFRLYRRRGNDLPDREARVENATCEIAGDGAPHRLTVRAWDAAGNVDSLVISIVGTPRLPASGPRTSQEPPVRPRETTADAARAWSLTTTPGEGVIEVRASTPAPFPLAEVSQLAVDVEGPPGESSPTPRLSPLPDGICAALDVGRLVSGPHRIVLRQVGRPEVLAAQDLTLVIGGQPLDHLALTPDLALTDLSGHGLFDGGVVWAETATDSPRLPEGTEALSSAWWLRSAGAAFRGEMEIALRLDSPDAADRVGLFRMDGRGGWSFLVPAPAEPAADPTAEPGGRTRILTAEIDDFGAVMALRDANPPYLGRFEIAGRPVGEKPVRLTPVDSRQRSGVTLPRWPVLELPITDAGAGLDADGIVCELDGQPYPARWDPEEERIFFELFVDPGPGAHRIRVEATDRLGNRSEKSLDVQLDEL